MMKKALPAMMLLILAISLVHVSPAEAVRGTWYIDIQSPSEGEVFSSQVVVQWQLIVTGDDSSGTEFALYMGTDEGNLTMYRKVAATDILYKAPDIYRWTYDVSSLPDGDYVAKVEALKGDAVMTSSITPQFKVNRSAVSLTVEITTPSDGARFQQGETITFSAQCSVASATLSWKSDIDGIIGGNTQELTTSTLSPGMHNITVTATYAGSRVSDTIQIIVEEKTVEAHIQLEGINLNVTSPVQNSSISIVVLLYNGYGKNVTDTIIVKIDGLIVDSGTVTVPPLSASNYTVEYVFSQPGKHNITAYLEDYSGMSVQAGINVLPSTTDNNPGTTDGSVSTDEKSDRGLPMTYLILGAVLVVLLIGIVAAVVLKKGDKKKKPAINSIEPVSVSDISLNSDEWAMEALSEPQSIVPDNETGKKGKKGKKDKGKKGGKGKKGSMDEEEEVDEELKAVMDEVFK